MAAEPNSSAPTLMERDGRTFDLCAEADRAALVDELRRTGGCIPPAVCPRPSFIRGDRVGATVVYEQVCFEDPRERADLIDQVKAAEIEGAVLEVTLADAEAPDANTPEAGLATEETARQLLEELQLLVGEDAAAQGRLEPLQDRRDAARTNADRLRQSLGNVRGGLRALGLAGLAATEAPSAPRLPVANRLFRRPAGLAGFFSKITKELSRWGRRIEAETRRVTDRVRKEIERDVRRALRTAARSGALEIAFRVVGTALTAGTGTPLLELAVSAVDRFGADGEALLARTIGDTAAAGAPTSLGADPAWAKFVSESAPKLVQVARSWGPVVAPETTNRVLQEIAKLANRIDILSSLPTLALSELTIQAEESKARRDQLRQRLAEIRADVQRRGGVWLVAARHAWQALRSAVVTVATMGAAAPLLASVELAEIAVSAAQTGLELANGLELARIARAQLREQEKARTAELERERAELEAEIARLRRELAEAGGVPPAAALPPEALPPWIALLWLPVDWPSGSFPSIGLAVGLLHPGGIAS